MTQELIEVLHNPAITAQKPKNPASFGDLKKADSLSIEAKYLIEHFNELSGLERKDAVELYFNHCDKLEVSKVMYE